MLFLQIFVITTYLCAPVDFFKTRLADALRRESFEYRVSSSTIVANKVYTSASYRQGFSLVEVSFIFGFKTERELEITIVALARNPEQKFAIADLKKIITYLYYLLNYADECPLASLNSSNNLSISLASSTRCDNASAQVIPAALMLSGR